jgi:hypothetical protein
MKGEVKKVKADCPATYDKMALYLTPETELEKKWLLNAFYCISSGVLGSVKGNINSLVLWTDDNHKLPKASLVPDLTVESKSPEIPLRDRQRLSKSAESPVPTGNDTKVARVRDNSCAHENKEGQ